MSFRPDYDPSKVDVDCPCGHAFQVPKSMQGGQANCPQCGKVVSVPGGPEPLFYLLLGGGILIVLLISGGFFLIHPAYGILALIIGAAIIGLSSVFA